MADFLAPAMFLCLAVTLFVGFPVAFTLAAVGGVFGVVGLLTGDFKVEFLSAMAFRVQGVFANDNLLAVPLLVFMGMLLERTGIADEMFVALNRLFGCIPGGLAYSAIVVGAILSAITGFVSASVIAMGLISYRSCCGPATTPGLRLASSPRQGRWPRSSRRAWF